MSGNVDKTLAAPVVGIAGTPTGASNIASQTINPPTRAIMIKQMDFGKTSTQVGQWKYARKGAEPSPPFLA